MTDSSTSCPLDPAHAYLLHPSQDHLFEPSGSASTQRDRTAKELLASVGAFRQRLKAFGLVPAATPPPH